MTVHHIAIAYSKRFKCACQTSLIGEAHDAFYASDHEPLHVVFVGNHFGRKGGCVTLRMAELAMVKKLPIVFHIVSKFEVGASSWTDPLTPGYFDRYRELLSLTNVRYHGSLPNVSVLELIQRANFAMLTTFSDTFGFSAIEAMANYYSSDRDNAGRAAGVHRTQQKWDFAGPSHR